MPGYICGGSIGFHFFALCFTDAIIDMLILLVSQCLACLWFSQDVQDMRDCYDSLLNAAAATANSAYGNLLFLLPWSDKSNQ